MNDITRRTAIRGVAGTAAVALVAGCLGGDDDDDGDNGDSDSDGGDDGDGDAESRADTFLSDNDAALYEGSVEDMTGEDEITIVVGADDNDTAFNPPGVRVDTGTNVIWEWSGNGGEHNVVDTGDTDFTDFGTDERFAEEGHTVENTFDEAGVAMYFCEPHAAQGMYGAIVIE